MCVGMTTRHLAARACEHLVFAGSHKSAIKDHTHACATCREGKYTLNSFQIVKRCHMEYETKIQEALLIKKLNSKLKAKKIQEAKLNKQFYAHGASFFA